MGSSVTWDGPPCSKKKIEYPVKLAIDLFWGKYQFWQLIYCNFHRRNVLQLYLYSRSDVSLSEM